jgi:predicted tellurium resistance membrane protein TerC
MEFFAFDWIADARIWASLVTLIALEVVLGVDNLVFISILSGRLPKEKQRRARRLGLALALVSRLALLATIAWIVTLREPFTHVGDFGLSWRDVILIGGGVFLVYKATHEIHNEVEGREEDDERPTAAVAGMGAVVAQIAVIDIVFSLDSVITAVGMADQLWVMVVAVVAAVVLMMAASEPLAQFIMAHPTVKMLALSFLLLIGVVLVADGLHFHIPKGYIYVTLAFSVTVEALNHWARNRRRRLRAAKAAA